MSDASGDPANTSSGSGRTRSSAEILASRQRHFGRGLSLSYRDPLTIVGGRGQHLYDENGEPYLDCVNNVCHVGHCHPKVVSAAASQMAVLNTNTRYLHPLLSEYLERLTATLPDPLSVCYLVCSGSEANELALRLARNYTGAEYVVALEAAYHGNTRAVIDVSEYKFGGPGGRGKPETTHVVPMPCVFRGRHRSDDASDADARREVGLAYAKHVEEAVASIVALGRKPAAFICESMLGVGGQIILPEGYLAASFAAVRAAGGVAIADEVQVGFGRCGEKFWAFEMQDVVPDIVVLGKPIGNGHPMAAVITTPEISEAFDNGMEYFNTFGGNPVSCAVGLAVLDVIEEEGLQRHALEVGSSLIRDLREALDDVDVVGEVRGKGLFIGIELIDGEAREQRIPNSDEAYRVVEALKEQRILLSVDGPDHNVIKFKPPMVFSRDDADRLVEALRREVRSPRR